MRSGKVEYQGKSVITSSLSLLADARKVADTLREWVEHGEFLLNRLGLMPPREGRVKPLVDGSERHGEKAQNRFRREQRTRIHHVHPRL